MRRLARCSLLWVLLLVGLPIQAGVTVGFDAETLNELLPAMTLEEVDVPLAGGRSLRVYIEDLKVLGFAPKSADGGSDRILTSVTLRVPALGLTVPVEPEMSLVVVRDAGVSMLELRFDEVRIPLPLGSVNAAPFLDPLRFPADEVFLIEGNRGDVAVRSRLSTIEMGVEVVRFEFDLQLVETVGDR